MELGEDRVMVVLSAVAVFLFLAGLAYALFLALGPRPRPAGIDEGREREPTFPDAAPSASSRSRGDGAPGQHG